MKKISMIGLGLTLLLTACGGEGGTGGGGAPQPGCAVNNVTIAPASAALTVGQTVQLSAGLTLTSANCGDFPVTWTSSDLSKAKVGPNGLVTAVASGSAVITATAGGKSAQVTVTVSSASLRPGWVRVTSEEPGAIYIDGRWTGQSSPADLPVSAGTHDIAVGTSSTNRYLTRKVTLSGQGDAVSLTQADATPPKEWPVLFIGVRKINVNYKDSTGKDRNCNLGVSDRDLDAAYDNFIWSSHEHFEKYAFNTIRLKVDKVYTTKDVVTLSGNQSGYYLRPGDVSEIMKAVPVGKYKTIYVYWHNGETLGCDLTANYFGLAWGPNSSDQKGAGWINIKVHDTSDIPELWQRTARNDPGIWLHEWLHTIERTAEVAGYPIPAPREGDPSPLHAAPKYGYSSPWMDWYRDFLRGSVLYQRQYYGITPDFLIKH